MQPFPGPPRGSRSGIPSTPPSDPLPVVCALIERDGRVLVARRPPGDHHLADLWEFPGGKIDAGEMPAAALLREIREELGVTLTDLRALPVHTHAYPTVRIALHPFRARLAMPTTEPRALEHAALQWVAPAALRDVALAAADIPIVETYLAALAGD